MNPGDTPNPAIQPWSEDMLWGLSIVDRALLLLDAGARVDHANQAAQALATRLPPVTTPLPPDWLLRRLPPEAPALALRDGVWEGTLRAVDAPADADADAATQPLVRVRLYRGTAADGTVRGLAVLEDVTGRTERELEFERRHQDLERTYRHLADTQEQLLQSEKMASIGQLAAGVAHEINNPIGYVHSNLGTLREYAGALTAMIEAYAGAVDAASVDPERVREQREELDIDFILRDLPQLLEESREGIERVTKIVQDLKEFSHTGRDEVLRPVDLHKGLDSTINIVWNDLKYKVQLEKHYGDLPPVECHPSELNQVFMNLLINAGQAIEERGRIVLATGVDGDQVWISVQDSGCGIPEEVVQRIFDPFFTTKPIGRGTGLGLAIAYRIVSKHHGRIQVQSRPGLGSTFRVVLPVVQPPSADGGGDAGAAAAPGPPTD